MPDTNIVATPPATPATVAPVAPAAPSNVIIDPRLPEGVVLKNDLHSDIDKYFDGDDGAPVTAMPKVAAPAAPLPAVTPVAPAPGSVAAKLVSKRSPVAPAPIADPNAAPAVETVEDTVAKVEAEMRAHMPKWKPAEGWTVLKTKLKTEAEQRVKLEQELTATKAKLTAPVTAGMTTEEIEALKAREKAASDRLMVLDLESHPTFKAQFIEPKNAEVARINEILAANGKEVDVAGLLAKPRGELGKAVAEAIKDIPEFDRVELAESIRKAYALDQSAKAALGQSRELAKNIQVQSVERQRKAFETRWAPVSATIGEYVQPIVTPADATPEQRAADEAYNHELAALRTKAEGIALSPISDEGVAESAIKAAAYDLHIQQVLPRVLSEYEQLAKLNQQLVAELQAVRSRNPNHRLGPIVGGGGPGSGDPTSDPNMMDHAQAADHFFRK